MRADGKISMPLLNDVQAAGLTPMQLGAALTDKLKKYVSDPHVTIVVTQMNSQRVYVTGEVLHPGAMNLTPNMTVLQALSSAGFTQFANTKGIYVLRNQNGSETKAGSELQAIDQGRRRPEHRPEAGRYDCCPVMLCIDCQKKSYSRWR